jgi:Kae1-associated kinase Bud32
MEELIKLGAEARIFKIKWQGMPAVRKARVRKGYRNRVLDSMLCKMRTKREATLLHKAKRLGVAAPTILDVNLETNELLLEYVSGVKAKECIENNTRLCKRIGESIAKLHNAGIIHGDLTMDNIIVRNGNAVFIDFGLGFYSEKIEDKATDMLNLKKSLLALRPNLEREWKCIEKHYAKSAKHGSRIIQHIARIEKRARYL